MHGKSRDGHPRALRPPTLVADVTSENRSLSAVSEIIDELGSVDILVNNAGLLGFGSKSPAFWGSISDVPLLSFVRMMETSFFETVAVTKSVLPTMMERNSGTIVNVASQFAWPEKTLPNCAPYDASKWAVWAFSRCLRQEVHDHDIRVVAIHPGSTATGDGPNLGLVEQGMVMAPDDIAQAIVYAVTTHPRVEVKDLLITASHE